MRVSYFITIFIAIAVINTDQAKGEEKENEWLIVASNAQDSIKNSVAKIKSYGASEENISTVTDNAFDDFVKYVKNGVTPILEKLDKNSVGNPRIKPKLNSWVEGLEKLNKASAGSKGTAQDSLDKFEGTIKTMVENAPKFAEKIEKASPESRETLLEIGSFIKEVIAKLANNMKGVEGHLKDSEKTIKENEWLTKTKKAQESIKDSITKIKSYGANEDRIKMVTDSAFEDFVKYVKNEVNPTFEKLNKNPAENQRIKMKLNGWIEGLEKLNKASASSKSTAQDSLDKFEGAIKTMVEKAPEFAEKVEMAAPETREILLEVGNFMKEVITRLSNNMKGVENQLQNTRKIVEGKSKKMN